MKYICPECESDELYITEKIIYELNSGKHFHDLVTKYDADAVVHCSQCSWQGCRYNFDEGNDK